MKLINSSNLKLTTTLFKLKNQINIQHILGNKFNKVSCVFHLFNNRIFNNSSNFIKYGWLRRGSFKLSKYTYMFFYNAKLVLHYNLLFNKGVSVSNLLSFYLINLKLRGLGSMHRQSKVKSAFNYGNFYYFSFKIYNFNLIINPLFMHCVSFYANNGDFNLNFLPYSGLYFTYTHWKTCGLLSFMPLTLYSLIYIQFIDKFILLVDMVGLDILNKLVNVYRLAIIYLFQSLISTVRYELIILNENSMFLSLSLDYFNGFFGGLWAEGEIFDLFGAVFFGNWDCGRILNDYGFGGFPLRKDFPLSGFFDCYYSLSHKGLLKQELELIQLFGVFYK